MPTLAEQPTLAKDLGPPATAPSMLWPRMQEQKPKVGALVLEGRLPDTDRLPKARVIWCVAIAARDPPLLTRFCLTSAPPWLLSGGLACAGLPSLRTRT